MRDYHNHNQYSYIPHKHVHASSHTKSHVGFVINNQVHFKNTMSRFLTKADSILYKNGVNFTIIGILKQKLSRFCTLYIIESILYTPHWFLSRLAFYYRV